VGPPDEWPRPKTRTGSEEPRSAARAAAAASELPRALCPTGSPTSAAKATAKTRNWNFTCWAARYYNPQAGRFLSHDPLRYQSDDVNLYAYVHNNPVNATDPDGKWPQWLDNATATVKTGAQRAGQAVKRTATATYETARGAAVAVGQGVSYAVSATGEAIATVGNKVEGVQLAALETFNQGLKLAGVTPDQFWQVIDNLGDVAKPLISQGKTLVGNFLGALNLEFTNFLANIGKHLLGGLTEWLLRRPITSFNLKDLAGTLLQVLELTWGHKRMVWEPNCVALGKAKIRPSHRKSHWRVAPFRSALPATFFRRTQTP
jgi:RHS repeat-associated protein